MNKTCCICSKEGKYKCPTCLIYYCSVFCCKAHRENKCELANTAKGNLPEDESVHVTKKFATESTIANSKLELLRTDKQVNDLLVNPHLKNLLKVIDESENPKEIMGKAMQEPLFVEFADACLNVVEPPDKEDIL